MASVGAAIILLSLPMDLFFQQIISYPSTRILDPTGNATISRAIFYDPDPEPLWGNGTKHFPADMLVESSIFPYWQGEGISPGVAFNCPTGNCTYDPFYTLALDFQCKAMPSTLLEFKCQNTGSEWITTTPYSGLDMGTPNVTACGHFLNVSADHLPQLMSGYQVLSDGTIGEVMSIRNFPIMDMMSNEVYFGGSPNFKDIKNPVTDFVLASTPGGFQGALNNNTPVLQECEIHWVVKKLQANVLAGHLTEESLETLQFGSDLDSPWDPEDGGLYRADFSKTLNDSHAFPPGPTNFGMDNTTAFKSWFAWADISPSTFILSTKNSSTEGKPVLKLIWSNAIPRISQTLSDDLPWSAEHNVTAHMAEAVTVMNQVVRRNSLSQRGRSDVAVGQAWQYVVLVKIRWQWLSLPLLLLVFSLMFLVATVVRSTKDQDNIGIFKTSALAILFNGLGEDVQDHVGSGSNKMGYTRERAKDMKVKLDDE